jgi:hypothetical protein
MVARQRLAIVERDGAHDGAAGATDASLSAPANGATEAGAAVLHAAARPALHARSAALRQAGSRRGTEADVNVYELRIAGVESDARLAAARWELFVCSEVRHVYRIGMTDKVAILYEGAQPDLRRWLSLLEQAGYATEPLEEAGRPPEAA